MRTKFLRKVLQHGSYDTSTHRYVTITNNTRVTFKRITLDALDTSSALSDKSDANPNGWETLTTWKA